MKTCDREQLPFGGMKARAERQFQEVSTNLYAAIQVRDELSTHTEDGWERSMLRASLVGAGYAHLAVIFGVPALGAIFGTLKPLGYPPGVVFYGFEGLVAAAAGVALLYLFLLPALLISVFGLVTGIIVNYWHAQRKWPFFFWCSGIYMFVLTWLMLSARWR